MEMICFRLGEKACKDSNMYELVFNRTHKRARKDHKDQWLCT